MAPEPSRAHAARLIASLLAVSLAFATPAHALRVVNWNILNYPGNTGPARDPLYRVVLAPLAADVVVTEETQSQAGVTEFLGNLNAIEPGMWTAAPFVDGNDTDSGLFYKPGSVQFLGQWAFYPNPAYPLRYIHVYRLKPVGYSSDAAEFRIYSLHLKASSGSSNVTDRYNECVGLRDSLNAMPPGTHVLVVGDYNFYTGLEPGMQKLIEVQPDSVGGPIGRLYDPLGLQNIAWQDNTFMQSAWTQSTCKTSDPNPCAPGAATGGLDDRFDLILPTYPLQDGAGIELVPGSYIVVGNDGQHHNNSIMDPPTIPEGATYAAALHGVSDHLPVRVDLRLPALVEVSSAPIAFGSVITGATVSQTRPVTNAAPAPGETLLYAYSAPPGFTAPAGPQAAAAGATNDDAIGLDTATPGAYSGALGFTSNSVDAANATIPVSGTVLRHAVASLDSAVVLGTTTLDFGTHDVGEFDSQSVRVHDQGWDALQARLSLTGGAIAGGAGRFSIVGGFSPSLVAGTGRTFDVAFDAGGAVQDSLYEATLTFSSSDEALPGATARPDLTVTLQATLHTGGTTAVGDQPPSATMLYAPFPNPIAGRATVRFDLARAGDVALEVFDLSGRRAATLMRGPLQPGRYSVQWNGLGENGAPVRAGLYFVRLSAPGTGAQSARVAVIR